MYKCKEMCEFFKTQTSLSQPSYNKYMLLVRLNAAPNEM